MSNLPDATDREAYEENGANADGGTRKNQDVFHSCQTGFRCGLNTLEALALIAEDLAGGRPRYDIKIAIAVPLKKAFDTAL